MEVPGPRRVRLRRHRRHPLGRRAPLRRHAGTRGGGGHQDGHRRDVRVRRQPDGDARHDRARGPARPAGRGRRRSRRSAPAGSAHPPRPARCTAPLGRHHGEGLRHPGRPPSESRGGAPVARAAEERRPAAVEDGAAPHRRDRPERRQRGCAGRQLQRHPVEADHGAGRPARPLPAGAGHVRGRHGLGRAAAAGRAGGRAVPGRRVHAPWRADGTLRQPRPGGRASRRRHGRAGGIQVGLAGPVRPQDVRAGAATCAPRRPVRITCG